LTPVPFSTDTRTLRPGETYVAIQGEVYDGHRFIPQAIEAGASGVVTEQDVEVPDGIDVIRVDDSVAWLVEQARQRLSESGARVVAITGSVGKTTTRAAVKAVLAEALPVVASPGNKNTPLGLSLLILNAAITSETVLVLEMGARLKGDIKELCEAFPPDVSIVTNVKAVHVETFGSIDGVQREKSELVRGLSASGMAVLNGDDPRTRAMADLHEGRVILYGRSDDCDLRPEFVTADLPILGDHAILTALAASGAGLALGMAPEVINRGLEAIRPEPGRLAKLLGRDGSTLIDDSYNASPDAALAALRVLASLPATRRIAALGDMLELGETEVEQHVTVLRAALEHADRVVAVGEIMGRAVAEIGPLAPEALERLAHVPTSREVAAQIAAGETDWPRHGDAVLVKGSQGARMERVSEAVLSPEADAAEVLPRQTEAWKAIP
ncbi:MAG: UDP-N-acetylmuramoyl-tripeptide--D-alanyl-D-alanine ligase, partial [Bacteroidota bacterium]